VEASVALGALFDDCAFERKDDLILVTNVAVISAIGAEHAGADVRDATIN
jgi:hypothetical protein